MQARPGEADPRRSRNLFGKMKVRHRIRTRAEGMAAQYAKPNNKRNRKNLGGSLLVRAGIRRNRVVSWRYLHSKWTGAAAANFHENDIQKVLRRLGPVGRKPAIVADRDPQATSPLGQGLRSAGSATKFYRATRPI